MKKVIAILVVLMSVISVYAENGLVTIYRYGAKLSGFNYNGEYPHVLSHDTINNAFYYDVIGSEKNKFDCEIPCKTRFVFGSVDEIYEFMTMFDGIRKTMDKMVYTNNGISYTVTYMANTLFMSSGNELYHVIMAQNSGRLFKLYIKKYLETGESYKDLNDMFND